MPPLNAEYTIESKSPQHAFDKGARGDFSTSVSYRVIGLPPAVVSDGPRNLRPIERRA